MNNVEHQYDMDGAFLICSNNRRVVLQVPNKSISRNKDVIQILCNVLYKYMELFPDIIINYLAIGTTDEAFDNNWINAPRSTGHMFAGHYNCDDKRISLNTERMNMESVSFIEQAKLCINTCMKGIGEINDDITALYFIKLIGIFATPELTILHELCHAIMYQKDDSILPMFIMKRLNDCFLNQRTSWEKLCNNPSREFIDTNIETIKKFFIDNGYEYNGEVFLHEDEFVAETLCAYYTYTHIMGYDLCTSKFFQNIGQILKSKNIIF